MTSDHLQESLGNLVIRVGALLILMPKPYILKTPETLEFFKGCLQVAFRHLRSRIGDESVDDI